MKFLGKKTLYAVAVAATMFVGAVSAMDRLVEGMKKQVDEDAHGQDSSDYGRTGEGPKVVASTIAQTVENIKDTGYDWVVENVHKPYVVPVQDKVGGNAGSIVAFIINDKKRDDWKKAGIYSAGEMVDNFKTRDWKQHLGHAAANYVIVRLRHALKQMPKPVVKIANNVISKDLCNLAARVVVSPVVVKTLVATGIYYCGSVQGRMLLEKVGYRMGRAELQ